MKKTIAFFTALIMSSSMLTVPAVSADTTAESISAAVEESVVQSKYDYTKAILVSSSGEVYYLGFNNTPSEYCIFTMNDSGNIDKSAKLSYDFANIKYKITGENICVLYNKVESGRIGSVVCDKFDNELNKIGTYDFSAMTSDSQYIDVSDTKVCYCKGKRLFVCDYDGSHRKTLLNLKSDIKDVNYFMSIAINDKYAAFTAEGTNNGKSFYRYGIVNIETGKKYIYSSDSISFCKSFGSNIVWYSGYQNVSFGDDDQRASGTGELQLLMGNRKTMLQTKTTGESMNICSVMTDDGQIVTYEADKNKYGEKEICIRIYQNKECIKEFIQKIPHSRNYLAITDFTANNGKIAISYSDKEDGNQVVKALLLEY